MELMQIYLQLRPMSLIFSKKNSLLVLDPDPQPYSVNCDVFGFVCFWVVLAF